VVLWMLFIEFEARYGKPVLAKELVLRAIRECPWSKGNLSHPRLIGVSEIGLTWVSRIGDVIIWSVTGFIQQE
jgi:membrane glycosyltransferase